MDQAYNSLQGFPKSRHTWNAPPRKFGDKYRDAGFWNVNVSALKHLEGYSSLFKAVS